MVCQIRVLGEERAGCGVWVKKVFVVVDMFCSFCFLSWRLILIVVPVWWCYLRRRILLKRLMKLSCAALQYRCWSDSIGLRLNLYAASSRLGLFQFWVCDCFLYVLSLSVSSASVSLFGARTSLYAFVRKMARTFCTPFRSARLISRSARGPSFRPSER